MVDVTHANLTAILKEVYDGTIEKQYEEEIVTLRRIEKTADGIETRSLGGKYVNFPIQVGRNQGIGYRTESEAHPTGGRQRYDEVVIPIRKGIGRGVITKDVMALAKTSVQSFVNAMDAEINGIKDDVVKDANRIAHGDGTGLLAVIKETADQATLDVDDAWFLEPEMLVDVRVIANGNLVDSAAGVSVVSVDELSAQNTVTLSQTVDATTDIHGIYRAGNYDGGTTREPEGLTSIMGTAALYGIDPASEPKWQGSVVGANGGTPAALAENTMILAVDTARKNGGKISAIFTTQGVMREYRSLLVQGRRFVNTQEFAGGFTGLPFSHGDTGDIPVVVDLDAPKNKMRFVSEKNLKVYRESAWHFADEDGSMFRNVYGYDLWEYFVRQYWQIGCNKRNVHVDYVDVAED